VAKLPYIEFSNGMRIPILHEDRNVIAIDKPQGWMLAPVSWQSTGRNLFAALTSSINGGDFWAKSRNLKFIRFAHRLDADTSGVLLLVRTPGAMPAFTELFEERHVEKVYLAVVKGVPDVVEWKCRLRIAPMPERPGYMQINNAIGKDSETLFRVIDKKADRALVMCWPLTGRTHQIRLHLAAVGHPVWADELYGAVPTTDADKTESKLALRAIRLSYKDPFMAEQVTIEADVQAFVESHGFDPANAALKNMTPPEKPLEHPKARLEEVRRAEKEKRKLEREARRADLPEGERRPFRPREEWPQDEDSAGFQAEGVEAGEGQSFEVRPPRRPFGRGPRSFERREGGFGRKPAPGRGAAGRGEPRRDFGDRPPRRPEFGKPHGKPFGKKPYQGPREFADGAGGYASERPRSFESRGERGAQGEQRGGFRGRPGGKPGYGRPFEKRGERRPFGGGAAGFRRNQEEDETRFNREGANERKPGVFPSSAKFGLKAGFQKFGASGSQRPFRSSMGGRPPGKFGGGGGGGGFGKKPFGKFGGGKPAWGKKPAGRPFKKFE
jgi:RluA family pseudouridine synthase